jgi:hypothetical protein
MEYNILVKCDNFVYIIIISVEISASGCNLLLCRYISCSNVMYGFFKDPELPPPSYSKERRRSSCSRGRDPDEILRSLKAVKGELGRTLSLSGDKRMLRREYSNV